MRSRLGKGLLAAVLIAPLTFTGTAHADSPSHEVRKLVRAVKGENVKRHLKVLDLIGKANGNTRVGGTRGYNLSRDYVASVLRLAGYKVTVQPFEFEFEGYKTPPVLQRTSPAPKTYAHVTEFNEVGASATGAVTAQVQPVDVMLPPPATPGSTSGCEAADFAGFTKGNIALIQRGTCAFADKVANAVAAGASAVILFNEGQPGRTTARVNPGIGENVPVPVLFAGFGVGNELASTPGTTVKLSFDKLVEKRTTYNVLAESRWGDDNTVVMAGAHLDSVQPGPGINDNGSGAGGVLEVALRMARHKPANKVRFGFWGGEEFGLLGSNHYVANLTEAEKAKIALYLNFDMIASPNFTYEVYDGDGDVFGVPGPEGSAQIEKDFQTFYTSRGLQYKASEFDGRSDYKAFIDAGIPGGGLFTGAEKIKTEEEAKIWGGTAGIEYDPCYHAPCDDIDNIDDTALDVNSDAIATLMGTYAFSKDAVNGIRTPGQRKGVGTARVSSAGHSHDKVELS
ncbi:M28 family metallopeptidase [Nonomuraea sp. NPDC059194]|uniref:M28 family metallopeptidase n=1 Tax=Nonomuraea sp. NPDC059194 TaxID=3346764 RepID=UPI0036BD09B7